MKPKLQTNSVQVVTVTFNPAIDQTLTVPGFTADKVNRVQSSYSCAGGKGVNVAAALSDLGYGVAVTGFLGSENAAIFEAMFAERGIKDQFIRLAGETRTGIKIIDPISQGTTDINFPGLKPRRSDIVRLRKTLEQLTASNRWFVLSGSLPPGILSTEYATLITLLKRRRCKVVLDTSGDALRLGIAARPDIIKPNIDELQALAGRKLRGAEGIVGAARQLVAQGVEMVVVSMGEHGVYFFTAEQMVVARPPRVQVKSTVGAGDAMVAGIVAAQLDGRSLQETAQIATAFSLEVITRGQSGLSSATAINKWAKRVSVCQCD